LSEKLGFASFVGLPQLFFNRKMTKTHPDPGKGQKKEGEKLKMMITSQVIDETIEEFGTFQCVLYFLLWLPASAMAIGVYSAIYMEYTPLFHCSNEVHEIYSPHLGGSTCPTVQNNTSSASKCIEWIYDNSVFERTVVTEFNLVCDSEYLKTLSKTTYMTGMLLGSLVFGWLGDRYGRKAAFALTTLLLSVGSVSSAVSPNFTSYVVARFLTSCGAMGLFITTFVLALEYAGTKYRALCGIAIEIPFALGELYIVLLAYFIRDWRTYQLIIGIPFFSFLIYLVQLPESLRWLISKGKVTDLKKTLRKIHQFNGKEDKLVEAYDMTEAHVNEEELGIGSVFRNSILRKRIVIMALNWVVATLGYYGLSLNSTNLSNDPFSSFALTAAMEIPSYIFCMIFLDILGRRYILSASQTLAGVACILAGVLPTDYFYIRTILSLCGKFGLSASFAIVYVYTAELFPTSVRNSSIGLCSTFARVGAMLAPIIANLSNILPSLPFVVMGCSCCIGGVFALFLPETAGKPLPDTLESKTDEKSSENLA